jgi:hypothetical protein
VYSHFGTIRHRSEQVEYRVEQHEQTLGDRLTVPAETSDGLRVANGGVGAAFARTR